MHLASMTDRLCDVKFISSAFHPSRDMMGTPPQQTESTLRVRSIMWNILFANITAPTKLSAYCLECVCVLVAQSCLILCDLMDCSLLGSSVHGILQARILEWVAISFSRGSSHPRDWTRSPALAGRFFTIWASKVVGLKKSVPSPVGGSAFSPRRL